MIKINLLTIGYRNKIKIIKFKSSIIQKLKKKNNFNNKNNCTKVEISRVIFVCYSSSWLLNNPDKSIFSKMSDTWFLYQVLMLSGISKLVIVSLLVSSFSIRSLLSSITSLSLSIHIFMVSDLILNNSFLFYINK